MGMYTEDGTTWESRRERDHVLTAGHFFDACNRWNEGEPAPSALASALAVGCLTAHMDEAVQEALDDVRFWFGLIASVS